MTKAFPNGVALVIGGTGGAGAEISRKFAENGTDVVLTYHKNVDKAAEVMAEIEALGQKADSRQLTIGDGAGVEVVIKDIAGAHGRIHSIVVAAGSDIKQPYIAEITREQWNEVVSQDMNGFFNVVYAGIPHFRANGGGSFVHIGSAGHDRWPERDALSVVPKAAIESLVIGIAREEGKHNIRANSVLLGVIETGIFLRLKAEGVFDKAWEDAVKDGLAIKRFGAPEEVAEAVVFLSSNKAAYVTGQRISVSGGYGL